MVKNARRGIVIFTGNKERLAAFYQAIAGLPVGANDPKVTVLVSDEFELVIHALPDEPEGQSTRPREDAYIKPFFPVTSLADARRRVVALGGRLRPQGEEWEARGFRACEGVDPDGNLIQLREDAT